MSLATAGVDRTDTASGLDDQSGSQVLGVVAGLQFGPPSAPMAPIVTFRAHESG
jgi:hypothetical protein